MSRAHFASSIRDFLETCTQLPGFYNAFSMCCLLSLEADVGTYERCFSYAFFGLLEDFKYELFKRNKLNWHYEEILKIIFKTSVHMLSIWNVCVRVWQSLIQIASRFLAFFSFWLGSYLSILHFTHLWNEAIDTCVTKLFSGLRRFLVKYMTYSSLSIR